MKKKLLVAAMLSTTLYTTPSIADQQVSVDYMIGFDDVDGIRFAYQPLEQSLSTEWFGELTLSWEVSAVVWEYGEGNTRSTSYAASLTPIIKKQITSWNNNPIYVEGGIGVSYIGDQEIAGKDIGSNYQFEDRLGVLITLDEKHDLALRYMHFSNGGFNNDNPGLDFLNFSYAYQF